MKVDWEQRVWEIYKTQIIDGRNLDFAISKAKEIVEFYKSHTKELQAKEPSEKREIVGIPLEIRQGDFLKECKKGERFYGKQMVQDFYQYWSEPSKSKKMRWELEKTWDLSRRMENWAKRSGIMPLRKDKREDQEYLKFIRNESK